jgi:hypothetical protein
MRKSILAVVVAPPSVALAAAPAALVKKHVTVAVPFLCAARNPLTRVFSGETAVST